MSKVKIRFSLQIHGSFASLSTSDIYMEQIIEFPFVPSIGMVVVTKGGEMKIENLYYDPQLKTLTSYREDKEIYNACLHGTEARPILKIVEEYKQYGWRVKK